MVEKRWKTLMGATVSRRILGRRYTVFPCLGRNPPVSQPAPKKQVRMRLPYLGLYNALQYPVYTGRTGFVSYAG